jgi:predicted RNA-binding Zn ribbon-like protein
LPDSIGARMLLGGRLAVDFANAPSYPGIAAREPSWEELVVFLEASHVVSRERGANLLALPESDPQAAEKILSRAIRLREGLRRAFGAMVKKERILAEWIAPINEILRITEGHDELTQDGAGWKLEFMAREGGVDWLFAAVARSAAEIIVEGSHSRLRLCANPSCSLYFFDASRTHRRRWCSMAICGNRHKVSSFAKRNA